MISRQRATELLNQFSKLRIGLIGDLFLDRYLEIDPALEEISIETGLPAHQIFNIRNSPGALGTVMNNLVAMRVGKIVPATMVGDDGHGDDLLRELAKRRIDASYVLRDSERLTPTYTKPMTRDSDGSWRELSRLDVRSRTPLSAEATRRAAESLRSVWASTDGLIVLDQMPAGEIGLVNDEIRDVLKELAQQSPEKLIYVDSRANIAKFRCGVLKTNHLECFAAMGLPTSEEWQDILNIVKRRADESGLTIVCTVGPRGSLVGRPGEGVLHAPGVKVTGPVDIVGAGDAVSSAFVATWLAGGTPLEAATMGNIAASITIQQLGTTGTASPEQILASCG